jgi:hypothetical protein
VNNLEDYAKEGQTVCLSRRRPSSSPSQEKIRAKYRTIKNKIDQRPTTYDDDRIDQVYNITADHITLA